MKEKLRCRRCQSDLATSDLYCPYCGTLQIQLQRASAPVRESLRRAGWYEDPFRRSAYRYWDGEIWTEHTYGEDFGRDVLSLDHDGGVLQAPRLTGSSPRRLALTLAGLVVSFGLSLVFVLADIGLGRPGGTLAELVVSEFGLWSGFLGTCVYMSRRCGSGSLHADFQLRFRWVDLGIGILGAIVGRCLAAVVVLPIAAADHNLSNPDQRIYGAVTYQAIGWTILVLVVCVGAPFFEELFFRGLLQGQLVQRFGPAVGIVVTSVVFGAAHIANDPGTVGFVLALSVAAGGLVLGTVRYLCGRLGSSMVTHSLFNLTAVIALAVALGR